MANKLTQIKRLLNEDKFIIFERVKEKIQARGFTITDIIKAIRTATDCAKMTDDPTHDRFVIIGGRAMDGTPVEVVVTIRNRQVIVKSLYAVD